MQPRELLPRSFARSDVQTAWIISAALLLAVLAPGMFLYSYAAEESLEEVDRWFDFALQVVVREVDDRGAGAIALEEIRGRLPTSGAEIRLRAPDGEILYERGVWPDPAHQIRAIHHGFQESEEKGGLGSFWLLRHTNWIVGERVAASGTRVELALPLHHFASENAEIGSRIVVGAAIAAVIGLGTTMCAFWPLRRATALLRDVDTGSLGLRLPSRATGDPLDLHAETLEAYTPSFEEAGVKLAAHCDSAAIDGDRVLLDRVVANLLDNALTHAPAGSRVEIHAARREGGLAITVDDAGSGIAEADRERVFDRFARLGGESAPGHGLGLALARAISELHGGSLRVAASPLGGARFELWLAQVAADGRGSAPIQKGD